MSVHVLVKSPPVRIGVLTNPHAKRNRAAGSGERAAALQAIVGGHGVVCETGSLEALRPAVERLLERGVRYVVADGGDGTLHWVVNEVLRALGDGRGPEAPMLVPGCGGTINFVARRAGLRGPADRILAALVDAERRGATLDATPVETLRLRGRTADGAAFERIGFCAALGGVGQRFFDRYYEDARPGPATIVKVILKGLLSMALNLPGLRRVAPPALSGYVRALTAPESARVRVDGEDLPGERWRAIDVGAIRVSFGGVVRLFPLAGDGALHLLSGNPSLVGIALALPRLVLGRRLRHGLDDRAARLVEVEAIAPGALRPVADGERLPALARVAVAPGPRIRVPRLP